MLLAISMSIDLSVIIKNRPNDAAFLKKIEQGYNQQQPFNYDPQQCFPQQLDVQNAHRPPFLNYVPFDSISSMLGTLTTAINNSHRLPISGLVDVIMDAYPNISTYFHEIGIKEESINVLMAQTLLKNIHTYQNAPVIECTRELYGLLVRCNVDSNIPVSHFRYPYETAYFDYSDIDIENRIIIAERYILDGCYLHVTTCDSKVDAAIRQRMLADDISTQRAIDAGFIDPNDTNDLYTLLFICHDSQTGTAEEIQFSFVVSRNLSDVRINDAIKALQPHDIDVIANHTDILFSQMSEAIGLIVNQCLYMISQPLDRTLIKERNNLYIALKRTHNKKKQRQIQRQIDSAKDCLRIGTQYYLDRDSEAVSGILRLSKRDPQLRRGHYRTVRFGEGRTQTKVKFIAPYWTGKEKAKKSITVVKVQ